MILNSDQLQARAREFALTNELTTSNLRTRRFWSVFQSDMLGLHAFAEQLANSRAECMQPAEDWLLDHIAFLETQAQEVLRKLPRKTLQQLPALRSNEITWRTGFSSNTGMPRIYAICDDYLEHTDGLYDVASFENYVQAYQEVSALKTMECWALSPVMRVAIIHRLAQAMREVQHRHEVCGSVAALLERLGEKHATGEQIRTLLDRPEQEKLFTPVGVVHLLRHLNEWEPDIRIVRDWLAAHIENSQSSLEKMVSFEHQLQAELQVICGNLVTSLHTLERHPWRSTFKKISHVEQILLAHAPSEYERMDFTSQDLLRGRVTEIARQLNVPETLVAHTAVHLATDNSVRGDANRDNLFPREGCLGHYLLDPNGILAMRRALSEVTRPRRLPQLTLRRQPLSTYMSAAAVLFIGMMVLSAMWLTYGLNIRGLSWVFVCLALALPVSEWTTTILHAGILRFFRTTTLLRYDFSDGLPEDASTMVVIPVIWSTVEDVDDVMDRLVVHYLANRQQHIYFAVLADFEDANAETVEGDERLVAHAIRRIDDLRAKYGRDKFFIFHRSRRYNPVDDIYMGWERKRGKLVEFVERLAGSQDTSFTTIHGETACLRDIRYVFTVDHDTQLPIGVVSRLAGTIHFPYNRPRLNEAGTRVVEGFGVLQPRVAVSFESTQKSRFAALWTGEPGIDPYAFAVANPHQDLFGKAAFVGKGIFDVEAFHKTVANRIPDNHVLSHDVLEGGFLRCGFASDIEIVEDYPSTFYAYQRRSHRWIRGDWQLMKWLSRTCQNRDGVRQRIDLCGMTRLFIADSMRRSLVAPVLFIVAWLGLHVLPGRELVWETVILLTIFLPFIRTLLQALLGDRRLKPVGVTFMQCGVQLITLPFAAILAGDAIVRALYRMFVSRRNLLEWLPAKRTDHAPTNRRVFVYEPIGYVVMALFAATAWLTGDVKNGVFGTVGLVIWLLARPLVARLNRPQNVQRLAWLDAARPMLNERARQIWSFYERYVTAEESWLPPDNVQYHPTEVIAHRTSPTNIGLYLACVVAARDLNFIDHETMLRRLENAIETLGKMEKWNGHLFNWYDTQTAMPLAPRYVSTVDSGNLIAYLLVVLQALREGCQEVSLTARIDGLAEAIEQLIENTDFQSLYNADEQLFCLGFHVDANRRETILYDLLASEARQASFVAIALGQVPVSHWFALSRTMTRSGNFKTLLSWSGTMFEYLMPGLIMRTYRNTVWDSTYHGVIHRQRQYADMNRVPFGISESGYYAFDYQLNYQYQAFGVPGLGLDRGLERNLVVAPYATILALPYAGEAAVSALNRFKEIGAIGEFGFYEAVDFTVERLPSGSRYKIIQSFMAHHQGMSMLTLVNLLTDNAMIERFHADPHVRAADLLLQERIPAKAAMIEVPGTHAKLPDMNGHADETERTFSEQTVTPEVNVMSNGRMTSIVTNDGNGLLTWNGLNVTRWREDPVIDTSGAIAYVHDAGSEATWSVANFPCGGLEETKSVFRLDKAVYEGRWNGISSRLEITVAPDSDAEVRRLRLVNESTEERTLQITTFLELALATQSADSAHPAFSKLFVQTSHEAALECLLAKRRPREEDEHETWAVHTAFVDGRETGEYEFETDRAAFIGRGYSLRSPKAIVGRLRGSVGSVADPAFIMRRSLRVAPGESATLYIVTGVADSRDGALDIVRHLREPSQADRAFHLAWVRTQIDLRHLHLTPQQATEAQHLAGQLLYTSPLSRGRREAIQKNVLGRSSLWSFGVSGDAPIAVVSVQNLADLPFVTLVARQHQYLYDMGVAADLVVIDETSGGYQDELIHRLRENLAAVGIGELKRIVGLKATQLAEEQLRLLRAVARVWLRAGGPSLLAQIQTEDGGGKPGFRVRPVAEPKRQRTPHIPPQGEFFNGWGGFVEGGKAYQMYVQSGWYLPRPWSNILANPHFGCILTELGTGYSWWRNSRECKLTPWTNDPVLDRPGECLYLSDLDTNDVWSATPKPAGGDRAFEVTHGWGYSRITQSGGDVVHEMETTVPLDDPLKIIRLKLSNKSDVRKRIAVTYYAEWVLGVSREAEAPFIATDWDQEISTLLASNTYQMTFRDAIGFVHIARETPSDSTDSALYSWTGDRTEFIGPSGTLEHPAALDRAKLSGRTGTFANTCGAVQTVIEIPPHEDATVTVLLGCAASKSEVSTLIRRYSRSSAYDEALAAVTGYWDRIAGQIQVRTPDRAMNVMLNGWLVYQALCCRLWARTAFYQAGGAFGFRDQLQDSLALLHADADITKQQILHNAAHQYQEGDVQHWWHDETGKGIRTKFSDDLLWLPYAVSRYIEHTGDVDILKEKIPFIHSEVLKDKELERYEDTVVSREQGTILEHCLRAIRHASRFGEHGIPLMGTGDWNDGMNHVGAKGRGESVWLGWFLLDIMKRFIHIGKDVDLHSDFTDELAEFRQLVAKLEDSLNTYAWDGAWFRRAFTDAGTWLGSIEDRECRIDAIAQSWSVISQGTSEDRQMRAMRSFDRELVDRELSLARLLTKPFDESKPSPGYIQGYPPGIRENGGQYTHGVIWSIVAWSMLRRGDKAFELFSMLNPIRHTQTSREVLNYGNEPYVMSADVYTAEPHEGRAGWSWYTGAAGWMYQAGIEYVLGVMRRSDRLYIRPCVPPEWDAFTVHYRFGQAVYAIEVQCGSDGHVDRHDYSGTEDHRRRGDEPVTVWIIDGEEREGEYLQLVDDGKTHHVTVRTFRKPLSTVG
ncbi:GH36-type glycosyl hydrolase domain-containing protein [Alicyclobacillus dauci]|uniref:Carbohydrate-binding protein n=1 Tax=Alicyclobacillus dauci TaxID=1475485 RepID=A0ABY6Z1P9_9BACL|nr:glucoamylase family protein [Alicyclobacillus dauci]WAH36810.1 carbohydrate-binding protein [Alicyclobacillus dauci]